MEDQYGTVDLRPYAGALPFFPAVPQPTYLPEAHPQYMLNFFPEGYAGRGSAAISVADGASGLICEAGFGGEERGAGRWPRQETVTLLEIRSRLDARFKEASQKVPLWEEVSRILHDEYGYKRSGRKCREKFENLYKYYKKTRSGKSGRQNGKHYRFFRQLEALYGDQTINNRPSASALALGHKNYAFIDYPYNFDTMVATSENDSTDLDILEMDAEVCEKMKKLERKSLKATIKNSIDTQMKKIMKKQEAWIELTMRRIDENEKEQILREEQWRKQNAERVEREKRLWAGEKARILAHDAALIEAFRKLARKDSSQDEEFIVRRQN